MLKTQSFCLSMRHSESTRQSGSGLESTHKHKSRDREHASQCCLDIYSLLSRWRTSWGEAQRGSLESTALVIFCSSLASQVVVAATIACFWRRKCIGGGICRSTRTKDVSEGAGHGHEAQCPAAGLTQPSAWRCALNTPYIMLILL